jgi:4-hydroxy-tetrahydrodipicolinate synthase
MQNSFFRGVIAAMLTPRGRNGGVDLGALERNVEFVLERGVAGVTIGGATGEYPSLTLEERRQIAARARHILGGRGRLICGAGAASFAESLAIAADAAEVGADAVLLPPPHFYHYTSEDVEAFYRRAAGEIRLPVILYNIPAFTAPVPPALALRLVADCPAIAGVKDSSGSLETLAALTRRFPQGAARIVGNDAALEAALAAGCCDAVVSGVAGVLPELVVAVWTNRSPAAGRRLAEFIDRIDAFPTPWGLKLAAELRSLFPASFPLPVSKTRSAQIAAFRGWFPGWWAQTAAELALPAEPLKVS